MENHPGKQRNHKDHMALVLADKLDVSSLLVAYRKAQEGGLGLRVVRCLPRVYSFV